MRMTARQRRIAPALLPVLLLWAYTGSFFLLVEQGHPFYMYTSTQEYEAVRRLPQTYLVGSPDPFWNDVGYCFWWPLHRTIRWITTGKIVYTREREIIARHRR